MKGLLSTRFALPNLARLRSRLENPPATLSKDLRDQLAVITTKVLNQASKQITAEFIDYISSRQDLKPKSDAHKKQIESLFSGIFDSCFATTPEALNALVGKDEEELADENPAEAGAEEQPKDKKATEKATEKAPKKEAEPKAEAAAKKEPDEFD